MLPISRFEEFLWGATAPDEIKRRVGVVATQLRSESGVSAPEKLAALDALIASVSKRELGFQRRDLLEALRSIRGQFAG